MSPKGLMIMGAAGAAFAAVGFISTRDPTFVVVAFAAGAVFGKGYGIQEERKP